MSNISTLINVDHTLRHAPKAVHQNKMVPATTTDESVALERTSKRSHSPRSSVGSVLSHPMKFSLSPTSSYLSLVPTHSKEIIERNTSCHEISCNRQSTTQNPVKVLARPLFATTETVCNKNVSLGTNSPLGFATSMDDLPHPLPAFPHAYQLEDDNSLISLRRPGSLELHFAKFTGNEASDQSPFERCVSLADVRYPFAGHKFPDTMIDVTDDSGFYKLEEGQRCEVSGIGQLDTQLDHQQDGDTTIDWGDIHKTHSMHPQLDNGLYQHPVADSSASYRFTISVREDEGGGGDGKSRFHLSPTLPHEDENTTNFICTNFHAPYNDVHYYKNPSLQTHEVSPIKENPRSSHVRLNSALQLLLEDTPSASHYYRGHLTPHRLPPKSQLQTPISDKHQQPQFSPFHSQHDQRNHVDSSFI